MAFTFQRDNFDPKYMALAKFFSDLSARQDETKANQQKSQQQQAADRAKQALQLVDDALKAGDFATADEILKQNGMQGMPNGGYAGMGQRIGERDDAAAAAKAEAARLSGEQSQNWMRDLVVDNKLGGSMTDESSGMPGIAAPRTNVWQTEETITPGKRDALLAMLKDINPTQLKALQTGDLGDDERLNSIAYELKTRIDPAKQADIGLEGRRVVTGERAEGRQERQFAYEREQDAKNPGIVGGSSSVADIKVASDDQKDAYNRVKAGMNGANGIKNLAADANRLALIVEGIGDDSAPEAYAKLMTIMHATDKSAFREGEQNTLTNNFGAIEKYRDALAKLKGGENSPKVRATIRKMAMDQHQAILENYENAMGADVAYAQEWGIEEPVKRLYGGLKVRPLGAGGGGVGASSRKPTKPSATQKDYVSMD